MTYISRMRDNCVQFGNNIVYAFDLYFQ